MRWVEDVSLSERPRTPTTLNQKAGVITEERARGGPFRFEVRWHCVLSMCWTSILGNSRDFFIFREHAKGCSDECPKSAHSFDFCVLLASPSTRVTRCCRKCTPIIT
ncbi:hypothetical protein BDZ45DRAFT_400448 [Acephala macrosclerotiorum]|nr:hypothetical protein BDZ45DRAFT_400448 [Acephala macrosclerotiorum]